MDSETSSKIDTEPSAQDRLNGTDHTEEPPMKKARLDEPAPSDQQNGEVALRQKGVASIKAEYLIQKPGQGQPPESNADDAAEESAYQDRDSQKKGNKEKKKKKNTGQNTNRTFGKSQDAKGLCSSRVFAPEFSSEECNFGDKCRFEHDLRTYLKEHKREDLTTLNGVCPVWDARGKCSSGWKCRFVGSHMAERETADGKKELILVEDEERKKNARPVVTFAGEDGVVNTTSIQEKTALARRQTKTPRADAYSDWLDKSSKELEQNIHGRHLNRDGQVDGTESKVKEEKEDNRATFTEPPFLPSEKRRLYFGPETPALAPLTTQGNLPFRRLCVELGSQFTYSEMALSMPLIQGHKPEWALMRAHESEALPPTVSPRDGVVEGYDNTKDLRFGAQIAGNRYRFATKATEVLSSLTPNLRVIDLNCGCPIDLLYREGAGSALLDTPSKLEKILRGMNAVSQSIPISVKIRTGTRDNSPNAQKLVERLVLGGHESNVLGIGPCGVAAVTLHGRSRQQRYTREANWEYISETAALIKRLNEKTDEVMDTIREPEERMRPNGGKTWFLGNGDCYSHTDYDDHITHAGVDSVMVGRGALLKPWLFEEIQAGQYLDKSASERLTYIEKFAKYGMETWGSDEYGLGITRRFMLEWLSFASRYVPIGLLEHLPPKINDRPPYWRGRNDLETLMGSSNHKDWIKISELFLGPAHQDFKFEPKHKSKSYEAEG